MAGRMRELQVRKVWKDQQREISPERTKVWTEPSNGKIKPDQRVAVVYYLCRNGQLEHPHFMEVPLSSPPQGLHLRDVINRLNVLRGQGMASLYSWSCKRSYKNGFVWHDLSENDFIYPAHSHDEYVLKGSELPPENTEQPRPLPSPESQITGGNVDYTDRRRRNQSCSSIDFNLHEYSVYKAEPTFRSAAAADASTQTNDNRRSRRRSTKGIVEEINKEQYEKDEIEIEISTPPSDSSPETLEMLMKADRRMMLQSIEDPTASTSPHIQRGKSSVLMRLISCGPGQGMGFISQYNKMRVPRGGRLKVEEKAYFSGSIVETKKAELPALKRSTSYNADR